MIKAGTIRFLLILLIFLLGQQGCSSQSKAEHFNSTASSSKYKPDEVIRSLKIKKGDYIADLGSGGGYYSFRFADIVGEGGRVFAVDINKDFIQFIEEKIKKEKRSNTLAAILASENDSGLARESVDLIFIRNVFHHLKDKIVYFVHLKDKLKKGGRIALIEYSGKGFFSRLHGHYTPPEDIEKTLNASGFRVLERFTFLEEQSFLIFGLKTSQD